MKTVTNLKLIARIKNIMRGIIVASFACFGVSIYLLVLFYRITSPIPFIAAIILLILAYTLIRIYILLAGRYGASPRLDERLSTLLKGLPAGWTLFNYVLDVPHVLVSQTDIWLLELYEVSGFVSYDALTQKWTYKKGGNLLNRLFSSDSFRDPSKDLGFLDKDWKESLAKLGREHPEDLSKLPAPRKLLVFMRADIELAAGASDLILLRGDHLKDYLRQKTSKRSGGAGTVSELLLCLPSSDLR